MASLAPDSWVDLGLPWRGGHEVPACFDQANGLFFKYGGCGDQSPRINVEGSRRPNETYGNSCWVANLRTGEWELRRPRDMSFPPDRPANGCSRGYCYETKRRVVWMYGGISNGGGGGDQWDFWSYDGRTDVFTQAHSKNRPRGGDSNGGDSVVYDSKHDLLIMPRGEKTWVYRIAENEWEERETPDGPPRPGHYWSMVFHEAAGKLVFPLAQPTGRVVQAAARPPATSTTFWMHERDRYHECEFATWTYDAAANQWQRLQTEGAPSSRWRCGLAYDSKNRVVILVGGSTNTWDRDEEYFNDVWVLDTRKAAWTRMDPVGPLPTGRNAWRDNRHCDYDAEHNVVLWQPSGGNLWAYRYK
ncbi:MAG: hypothetical protein WD069_02675 [Planctomycetales bacterium]